MPAAANLSRPAYLSLAEQFARAIESGEIASGTRLMPHRKLADQLGLSVQTVSRAYEELTRRGLVQGEIGRGSFVLGPGGKGSNQSVAAAMAGGDVQFITRLGRDAFADIARATWAKAG